MLYYLIMRKRNKSYKENVFVKCIRCVLVVLLFPCVLIYLIKSAITKQKIKKANQDKIAVFNMTQIDRLSGTEFELMLKNVFECLGYKVELTKKSHDYGADLVVSKNKNKALVQAKCYGKTVGVKAVQEIIASRKHYGINDVIVATNNYFSKDAQVLASENDVMLFDRDMLFDFIKKYNIHIESQTKTYVATRREAVQQIEERYRFWI